MGLTRKILFDLIKIDSREGKESEIAEYLETVFKNKGYEIFKQEVPQSEETKDSPKRYNLIITKGNPRLFFFSHMDTVQDGDLEKWKNTTPHSPVEKDGRIYGLGAVDMKGGLAASIAAVLEQNPENIGMCFTCDEEYKFAGIKTLVESDYFSKFNPELVVFCEPTDLEIINTHRGCLEIKVEVDGESAHATRPEEGRDASKLYLALMDLRSDLQERFGNIILNIGYFQSGRLNEINKIPEKSTATIDIRPFGDLAKKEPEYVIGLLKTNLERYGIELSGYTINFNMKPLNVEPSQLQRLERIVKDLGLDVKYADLGGTSEAGEINFNYGVPCVNFGPSPKRMSHKEDEYVDVGSLMMCVRVYEELIREYCD